MPISELPGPFFPKSAEWYFANKAAIRHPHLSFLGERETLAAMVGARQRRDNGKLEMEYRGEWMSVCRMDLNGDVISSHSDVKRTEDYLDQEGRCYGAGVGRGQFCIIDQISDN